MAISSPTSQPVIEPAEFAEIVGPCLTLVAPSGMSRDDKRAWAHAAHKAIGDVRPELLKQAAAEAMKVADHPSKIIPAITKALSEIRARQERFATTIHRPDGYLPDKRQPIPHEETQAILRSAGIGASDHDPSSPTEIKGGSDRKPRMPTRADYLRLGVTPETLDGMGVRA